MKYTTFEALELECESLRQQLAELKGMREEVVHYQKEFHRTRDQLSDHIKREVMLRNAINDGCLCIAQYGEQPPQVLLEALAATDDFKDVCLCHAEPVGYVFQHEDTGRTMCVEAQQVEWNFEKNNPRLFNTGPLYRAWEPK